MKGSIKGTIMNKNMTAPPHSRGSLLIILFSSSIPNKPHYDSQNQEYNEEHATPIVVGLAVVISHYAKLLHNSDDRNGK